MTTENFTIPIFAINDRVCFITDDNTLQGKTGKVIGYSCYFPVMYIVLLDKPMEDVSYEVGQALLLLAQC